MKVKVETGISAITKAGQITRSGMNTMPANTKLDATNSEKASEIFSKSVYTVRRFLSNSFHLTTNAAEEKFFHILYRLTASKKSIISSIENVCKASRRHLLGEVTLKDKATGAENKAFLTIRKINMAKDYSKGVFINPFDDMINFIIERRRLYTLKSAPTNDLIQNHARFSTNSFVMEILDNHGVPLGIHLLDISPSITEGKGLKSFVRAQYQGIGSILTEMKGLTGAITGSKNVQTIGSWSSMPFHIKSGYVVNPNSPRLIEGQVIYMPAENIAKLEQKYANNPIKQNLTEFIQQNMY